MRIVHIITRLIIGGAQENTLLTCAGLAERGHEVTLISGIQTGPEGSLWPEAERLGVRTVPFPLLVRQIAPLTDWRCARQLRKLLAELRPDIVHTHSSKAGILGRWAASRTLTPTLSLEGRGSSFDTLSLPGRGQGEGATRSDRPSPNPLPGAERATPRVVHTIHGMSFNRTQPAAVRAAYRILERRAARWTDAFISVADAMTEQAVAAGIAPRERFTTIYSGMRVEDFAPDPVRRAEVRRQWGVAPDEIVVGTIARLFRNKGYEAILEAMPRMVEGSEFRVQSSRLRFVWVGDGRHRPQYLAKLTELGLRERVQLPGLLRPEEIPKLLTGFDLLLHASLWEGLPRAAVQALLTQVAVVTFDLDGAREVVEPGVTGLLVPAGDANGLAEAVIQLAGDPDRRAAMGRAGRTRVLER
ncbi:MAG TPA: glycosyltransferase family 4 protein, partial [Phycisphaerae bacterium]